MLILNRFVGLTPGVLVCLGVSRWLSGFLGGRNGSMNYKKQGQAVRSLRLATISLSLDLYFVLTVSKEISIES